MDRKAAPESAKWNFSLVVKNDEEYKRIFNAAQKQAQKLVSYRGKLKNKKDYIAFTSLCENYNKNIEKLSLYNFLKISTDNKNVDALKKDQELIIFYEQTEKDLSFVPVEEKKFSNAYIHELASAKELESYKQNILDIIDDKKHTLPEPQEKLLSGVGSFTLASEVYNNLTTSELTYADIVMPNGKKVKMSESLYSTFLVNKNASVRKQAMLSAMNAYKKHNLSIAANYISHIKSCDFFATSAKFKSTFERRFHNDKISTKVYDNLISSVHKNLPLFYLWAGMRKKIMKGKLSTSDFLNPLFAMPNKKYTYEQALEIVKAATSILGSDYTKSLEKLTSGGYVDVYPTKGKDNGAFETSDHNGQQFVLLNHVGGFNSVEAMAHEFGHAMHSRYSEKKQPYNLRDYTVFIGEIASTVNEILLMEHMKQKAKMQKEKLAYTEKLLQMAMAAIFRQTMFSEFEYFSNETINKKLPLTYDTLNEKFHELNKIYYGNKVKIYPENKYGWLRIPHFYRPFYVYTYATGMLAAMLIVKKIKENPKEYVPKYKAFLSAGSSAKPNEILKLVGIDFETEASFNEAFDLYKSWVNEYKEGAKC